MATAPTFTPAEVAIGKEFFSANPTGDQMFEAASKFGLSGPQMASLYQQSMGGDYGSLLGIVNDYLGDTKSLPGGYQIGLLNNVSPVAPVAPVTPVTPVTPVVTAPPVASITPVAPTTPELSISQAPPVTLTPSTVPAMPTISGEDYFSRYFPVTVTFGQANPSTALNNVSGQLGLDTILANIQGQYTPQIFTRSGGSYGAGRFIGGSGQLSGVGSPVDGGYGFTIDQPTFTPSDFNINDYIDVVSETPTPAPVVVDPAGTRSDEIPGGGTSGGGTPGGQGVSNTGINAALNAKALLDPLGKISLLAKIAGAGVNKYLDSQIDAISESFDVLAGNDVEKTGMYTIVDKQGNVYKISNDDSIAAQLSAIFGTQPGASTADPSPVELGMTPSPAEGGGYVDDALEPNADLAAKYTTDQLNNIQTFWDSKPTTDQILEAIEINKRTPEQAAETWAIATGGDKQVGLNIFNEYMAANPDRDPRLVYDPRLDQSSGGYDPAAYNRAMAGLSGSGGTVGSGNISGGFVPVGLLNTGVVVGGPITGGLSQTTPLGPLSVGNNAFIGEVGYDQ